MKPRDAATLIIVREQREVLLGVRSAGHVFMPHMYVFPGGKVDPGDARVACPLGLRPEVEALLTRSVSPARARALAMTAVRETFEETGLVVGRPQSQVIPSRSPHWQPFFAAGMAADLSKLEYVARAITPPNRVRRFDARFFLVDASHVSGELRGNGELEDLRWVNLEATDQLELSPITALILQLLRERLRGDPGTTAVPFYRQLAGRESIEYE